MQARQFRPEPLPPLAPAVPPSGPPPGSPAPAPRPQGAKSFFSEIIASISDIRFSRDGRYLLSRDYMTVKLWDLAKESEPLHTFNVHEGLRQRVRRQRGARAGQPRLRLQRVRPPPASQPFAPPVPPPCRP
jgi:hypothetical protein